MKLPFMRKSEDGQTQAKQPAAQRSMPSWLTKPMPFMVIGALLILSMTVSLFMGSAGEQDSDQAMEQGRRAVAQVLEAVVGFSRVLEDEQVMELARMALTNPEIEGDLERYIQGRIGQVKEVRLFEADNYVVELDTQADHGFITLNLLMDAHQKGKSLVESYQTEEGQRVAGAVAVREGEEERGILLVTADLDLISDAFNTTLPKAGYIALQQNNGRFAPTTLKAFGDPAALGASPQRLPVPASLFSVVIPRAAVRSSSPAWLRLLLFVVGGLALAYGIIRRQMGLRPVEALEEDPATRQRVVALAGGRDAGGSSKPGKKEVPEEPQTVAKKPRKAPTLKVVPPPEPEISLEDIHFDPEKHRREHRSQPIKAVNMREDIFRAYDIRGIVGETLDAGVAKRIGQAVGSTVLEAGAGPVVVGRDGRHSGPDLVDGLVEGIASTGCDVIDIGAVPTGVLYYMANECDSGSGVMVTGSHNPPDYNGFKIMIGGETLSGEKIKALYRRLESGDIASGEGEVTREQVLERYRERIASDIQLERPLKVVADCGNGIGGICAADVLRAIGAEVLPLFDEVDGDFPNHHPDPSEPENLNDLIESVSLMNADLGVAFDGDADRLGVVTPAGEIVYADRVMMLFVREILSRNPGAPIIYDVKCTGKLEQVIREAGGEPEMYKTGHSLIKNRMREVGAPFAGEMSGHFFFGDRWYGFDCGIYSAARLLEILAMDSRSPGEVLESLPNSISTPELKVHMAEGENHAFIERFQKEANFPDARVSTIDGVRADFEDGWGLCRASNTTPILVVRFDADNQEALELIQEAFRMQMLAINPDLELPF